MAEEQMVVLPKDEVMVHAKPITQSKLIWFNLIAGVAQVVDQVGGSNLIPEPYGAAVQSVINIVLRVVSTSPLKMKMV